MPTEKPAKETCEESIYSLSLLTSVMAALSAANYLEKYFDCVDTMPLELQRSVSRLRELELQHRRLLGEVDVLKVQLEGAVAGGNEMEVGVAIQRLQRCMLAVRELGNLKMEVSSQLVETVEEYGQQLSLSAKVLDSPRSHDDHHHHSPRHTSTSSHSHNHNGKNESQLVQAEATGEKTAAKRTSSAKKPRTNQPEKPREREDTPPTGPGRSRENSTTSSVGGGGGGGGGGSGGAASASSKLPRKKMKAKKKVTKETTAASLPDPTNLPMPDLSSQPLDPDEPLYCHCQQVSFGEMIGCDNEDCPIEWFHFQCVGLTSKPKGKWYCPQCAPDRKTKGTK